VSVPDLFAGTATGTAARARSRRRRSAATAWDETSIITRIPLGGEGDDAERAASTLQLPVFRQRQLEERGELELDRATLDLRDYADQLAQRKFARRVRRIVMVMMLPVVAAFSYATAAALIENRPTPAQVAIERVFGHDVTAAVKPASGPERWPPPLLPLRSRQGVHRGDDRVAGKARE
jgi:hypothetical protein